MLYDEILVTCTCTCLYYNVMKLFIIVYVMMVRLIMYCIIKGISLCVN